MAGYTRDIVLAAVMLLAELRKLDAGIMLAFTTYTAQRATTHHPQSGKPQWTPFTSWLSAAQVVEYNSVTAACCNWFGVDTKDSGFVAMCARHIYDGVEFDIKDTLSGDNAQRKNPAPVYSVLTSGKYDEFRIETLVSGVGNLDVLWRNFQALLTHECRNDDISGTHKDLVNAAAHRLGLTVPQRIGQPNSDYDYVPEYFERWLVKEHGFTSVPFEIHDVDDIKRLGT